MQPAQPRNDVLAVVMTVGLLEPIRTAWISDDAANYAASLIRCRSGDVCFD